MDNESEIICVIGRRGSGKTYLVKNHILPELPRYIVFDQNNEFADMPNASRADTLEDLEDFLEVGDNIIIPAKSDIGFEELCFILNESVSNYYLVVDEFHMLYQNYQEFTSKYAQFKKIVLTGRHDSLGLVIITQRPSDLPPYLLSQCTILYIFNVYLKKDLVSLSNIINDPENCQKLQNYEYYKYTLKSPLVIELKKT